MAKQLVSGASVPANDRSDIVAALNAVATAHNVDPAAIAGMIYTESVWKTKCVTGRYIGLTQVGPEIPKLLNLTREQFLLLSAAQQIQAYGKWLDYYHFSDQMAKYGIEVQKQPLARQAALLQAMQFAPNGPRWKVAFGRGDYTVPSTSSKQADVLGDTSIRDMESYYGTFFQNNPPVYAKGPELLSSALELQNARTIQAFGFGMFGMFGAAADPVNFTNFCRRVAGIGVNIMGSPYRDYDTQKIVDAIMQCPAGAKIFVFGASLGANNCPVIGVALDGRRVVNGMWGFQASLYGARAQFTPNVLFAHEAYNPNFLETGGLGALEWTTAPRNTTTKLVITTNNDMHPGDYDVAVQNMFLDDMRRLMTLDISTRDLAFTSGQILTDGKTTDINHIPKLTQLGSDAQSIQRIQVIAANTMKQAGLGYTLHNACAATLSAFLNESGIAIPVTLGAGKLANRLSGRGWERVAVGKQKPGDVAVTFDQTPPPGADHIFLVVRCDDTDKMLIADNQAPEPHTRYASGRGKTPTEYFLRAPDSTISSLFTQLTGVNELIDSDSKDFFPSEDEDTNELQELFLDDGSPSPTNPLAL